MSRSLLTLCPSPHWVTLTSKQTNKQASALNHYQKGPVRQKRKKFLLKKKTFTALRMGAPCLIFSCEFGTAQQLCSFPGCICFVISNMGPQPYNRTGALPFTGSLFSLIKPTYCVKPIFAYLYLLCTISCVVHNGLT